MQIITEPTVHLLHRPTFQEHPTYKIPSHDNDLVQIGTFAAKGCYDSFGEDGRPCEANQRTIIEHKHGSVLEHLNVGFFIEGITRSLSLELNRHRHFAISQRSTRYTEEEDAAIVLEPYYAEIWNSHKNDKGHVRWVYLPQFLVDFIIGCEDAFSTYSNQVEQLIKFNPYNLEGFALRKWARGKARNVLPHCLETRGTWTMNLRGWRWFVEARSSRHAESEIRRLAHHVFRELVAIAPVYFEDFEEEMVHGIPEYTTEYSKI